MFILRNYSVKANLIITIIMLLRVEKDSWKIQAATKLVSVLMYSNFVALSLEFFCYHICDLTLRIGLVWTPNDIKKMLKDFILNMVKSHHISWNKASFSISGDFLCEMCTRKKNVNWIFSFTPSICFHSSCVSLDTWEAS